MTVASRSPSRVDRRIALGLFALTFLVLFFTEAPVGFVRDESVYFAAADAMARWLHLVVQSPARAFTDATLSQALDFNHEHPMLMKTLFALSSILFHDTLHWMRPAAAYRVPAFAVAALIPALLHLFGSTLYSRKVGLFAAVSFYAVPRQFFDAHLACFDVPIAAFWLLTVYTFWRAQTDRKYWLYCGLSFGLAVATKHNGFFLPFVLCPFALYRAEQVTRKRPAARGLAFAFVGLYAAVATLFAVLVLTWGPSGFVEHFAIISPQTALGLALASGTVWLLLRLHQEDEATFRSLAPLGAMALLGPVIFYAHWPYLWPHPAERIAWYFNFHATHVHYAWLYLGTLLRQPPFPLEYVFVKTALTVPLSLLVPMALGLIAVLIRGAVALLPRPSTALPLPSQSEVLIAVNALASILVISHPQVPHFGGVKHWFPSMCFLALLGGQSVVRALDAALVRWPHFTALGRGWGFTSGVMGVILLPAVLQTAHVHPYGTSSYSELAGGIPGAASLGMQRQFWSNNVTGVLPYINEHARPQARVWLHEVAGLSFRDYQVNGMLRGDLIPVGGPEQADIAAYQYHQEFREQEMNIWQAFGTTRPVYGLYLDQTPQVMVYQRP